MSCIEHQMLDALKTKYSTQRLSFSSSILLKDIYTCLAEIDGVQSVIDVAVENRVADAKRQAHILKRNAVINLRTRLAFITKLTVYIKILQVYIFIFLFRLTFL